MSQILREPPNSLEAEQAVIGGLLLGGSFEDASSVLTASDFYWPNMRILFGAIGNLVARNMTPDLITVSDWLEARKELDIVGGIAAIADLIKNTPSAANVAAYCHHVKDRSQKRKLLVMAQTIAAAAHDGANDAEKLIIDAQNLILSVDGQTTETGLVDMPKTIADYLQDLDDRQQKKTIAGLKTGFAELDYRLKGLKGGHVHVIAARPGAGKTTLAINIAENIAATGVPVLIFSLEMPARELVQRMIASLGRISVDELDSGEIKDASWEKLSSGVVRLKDLPVQIVDRSGLTAQRIRTIARFQRKARKIGLVVVDYIGLIKHAADKGKSTSDAVGETMHEIKAMAKELGIPVLLLAQLNRGIEGRGDKTPTLSDLRSSGDIENDADSVTMLYRPADSDTGETQVTIAKNRHGRTGNFNLILRGDISRFESVEIFKPMGAT